MTTIRRSWWKKIWPEETKTYAHVQMRQFILNQRRAIGETILPREELTPTEQEMLENLRTIAFMKAQAYKEALQDLETADWYDPETMSVMETLPPSPYVMVVRNDTGEEVKHYGPEDPVEEDHSIMRLKSFALGRPLEGLIYPWWEEKWLSFPDKEDKQ